MKAAFFIHQLALITIFMVSATICIDAFQKAPEIVVPPKNEKKPKIAYWSTWKIKCGIAVYTENLCKALEHAGYTPTVYRHDMPPKALINALVRDHIDVLNIQFEPGMMKPIGKLIRILREIRKRGVKIILTIHKEIPGLRALVPHVNHFICFKTPQFLNTPKKTIIHHGVPLFSPEADKTTLREKYGFSDEHVILTTTGFLTSWKEYDVMLDALVPWIQSNPNNRLQLLTSYNTIYINDCAIEDKKIKEVIARYHLEDQVIHLTHFIPQQELSERLWLSDLGYLWGTWNTTSGVAAQLIAARLPSIATNSPHYHDLIAGTIKTASEKEEFVSMIAKTINDKEALQKMRDELEQSYNELNYNTLIAQHIALF